MGSLVICFKTNALFMQIKKYKNERIPELQKHVLNCKKIFFFLVFFVKRDIVSTYSPPDPTYLRS